MPFMRFAVVSWTVQSWPKGIVRVWRSGFAFQVNFGEEPEHDGSCETARREG